MSEQLETTAPAVETGNDFVEVEGVRFPPAENDPVEAAPEPEVPAAEVPVRDPDFSIDTLENGEVETRLATGQVYRGKSEREVLEKMAKAQFEASRTISELRRPAPVEPAAPQATEPAIDPSAFALADLLAPAFGAKTGKELIEAFQRQQQTTQQYQENLQQQQMNAEAMKFFAAVPEFSKSAADAEKIETYLATANVPMTAQTAEMAYYALKAKGEFKSAAAAAPRGNIMPPPPSGNSPAATGSGQPSEKDLYAMSPDELLQLMSQHGAQ